MLSYLNEFSHFKIDRWIGQIIVRKRSEEAIRQNPRIVVQVVTILKAAILKSLKIAK